MRRAALALAAATLGVATLAAPPRPAAAQARRDDDDASRLLVAEARRAIARRDYARAGKLLDRALEVAPRRIDVYVLRASVHGARDEHARAVALLRRARRLAPDSVDVAAALGIQLVLAGETAEGAPLLATVVADHPDRYDAQVVLGHHHVRQARWDDAVAAFTAYFAHRPAALAGEDAIHQLDHATALLRTGDARAARARYAEVLTVRPDSVLARMGEAWATAAIDCAAALPRLAALDDLEPDHPEIALVISRCAVRAGRLDDARAAAARYRAARPDDADGWLAAGEVELAAGDARAAERAFTAAVAAAPASARHALALARAERALGKDAEAAARLRAAGPPPAYEADWTRELGEALRALGAWDELDAHIAPWAAAHPDDGVAQLLLGAARLGQGDAEGALAPLDAAVAAGEARARRPLVDALDALAVAAIAAGDLDAALARLERAEPLAEEARPRRNLGAVLLARGEPERARAVLERVTAQAPDDAVAHHLHARALHALGRWAEARAAYARAIRGYGAAPGAAAARADLAHAELAAGDGDAAVDALDAAIAAAVDEPTRARLAGARVTAARAAATEALRAGRFAGALRVLRGVEARATDDVERTAIRCDLALAATGAGAHDTALDHLARLDRADARCPFVPPADELAVPLLVAWNEGAAARTAVAAQRAVAKLDRLARRASGVVEPLARGAARDVAARGAVAAYDDGDLPAARKLLVAAQAHDKRSPELAHDLLVLDVVGDKAAAAIPRLEALTEAVPHAWITLGVAYERDGRPIDALAAWRRARAAGVRFAPLDAWIAAKERAWEAPR